MNGEIHWLFCGYCIDLTWNDCCNLFCFSRKKKKLETPFHKWLANLLEPLPRSTFVSCFVSFFDWLRKSNTLNGLHVNFSSNWSSSGGGVVFVGGVDSPSRDFDRLRPRRKLRNENRCRKSKPLGSQSALLLLRPSHSSSPLSETRLDVGTIKLFDLCFRPLFLGFFATNAAIGYLFYLLFNNWWHNAVFCCIYIVSKTHTHKYI